MGRLYRGVAHLAPSAPVIPFMIGTHAAQPLIGMVIRQAYGLLALPRATQGPPTLRAMITIGRSTSRPPPMSRAQLAAEG